MALVLFEATTRSINSAGNLLAVLPSAGGAEDEATLERLRATLALFEGTHPFHNYTKRRLYRAEVREGARAKVALFNAS